MDSLSILREMQSLLQKTHLAQIGKDIKRAAEEAVYLLEADAVVAKHFSSHYTRLLPLLREAADVKDDKQLPKPIVGFFLKELILELEESYKASILVELDEALLVTKSREAVFRCLGTLLSRLLDEGHSLEGLYGIVFNRFIRNVTSSDDAMFLSNYDLAKRIITFGEETYEVIFRLEYGRGAPKPYSGIQGITFYDDVTGHLQGLQRTSEFNPDLLIPRQNALYAKVPIRAQEDRTAGLRAREQLDAILDLLRFEMETQEIRVHHEFFSIRGRDGSARAFALPSQMPNPEKNVTDRDFQRFLDNISSVTGNPDLEKETTKRIRSAFRFYRMGRDGNEMENRFLNWWTGLEYLTRSGESSSIIGGVERIVVNVLTVTYIGKLLASFAETFAESRIAPSATATAHYGVARYADMNPADLFTLLHEPSEHAHFSPALARWPLFEFRLDLFLKSTADGKTTRLFLDRHERHLRWHVHRLYRVRCDIVHSAEYDLNLTLLGANLEYYLKTLLRFVLEQLGNNNAIGSLNELYERTAFVKERLTADLFASKTDVLHTLLVNGKV
jgi:hypothetical protein